MREYTLGMKYIPIIITGDEASIRPAMSNFFLFDLDSPDFTFKRSILPQIMEEILRPAIKIIKIHIAR